MSSIPGVPYPVYVAGSRITHMYPFGPLPGCAAMITLLSHDGDCCIGINTDTPAVADPGRLADDLREGLDEVVALGRGLSARSPAETGPASSGNAAAGSAGGVDHRPDHLRVPDVAVGAAELRTDRR